MNRGEIITLKSSIRIIDKYKGKSKFEFWKNIEIGDVLEIINTLRSEGYIIKNIRNNSEFTTSVGVLYNYLRQLRYEQLN